MASIHGEASENGWFIREKGSFVKLSRMNPPKIQGELISMHFQHSEIDLDPFGFHLFLQTYTETCHTYDDKFDLRATF